MLFWIVCAFITAITIALLLRPLLSQDIRVTQSAEADLAVYRDQLAEIESDIDRGLISGTEAEAARVELARRLLSRADAADARASATQSGESDPAFKAAGEPAALHKGLSYALAAAVPLMGIGFYLAVGAPGLPSQPYAERIAQPPGQADIETLIAKVEAQLRQAPQDGQGWDVIAPVYLRVGRYDDAANAFRKSIRLNGETVRRLSGLAQALIIANNGVVNDSAKAAYAKLLEKQPENPQAKFWLATARAQEGDKDGALKELNALLEGASETVEWRALVENQIARISGKPVPLQQAPSGPDAAQIAAAREMTPEQRKAFIDDMVGRLATRLKEDSNDADGWQRLIQAYSVLGRAEDARNALESARKTFSEDADVLARFERLEKTLGL